MSEGRKNDQDKLPWHLLPPELMESVAAVLKYGAQKYEPRNWEKGMAWSRIFSAMMRHSWAWWRGEQNDPETGMSHLWHAGACLSFLIAYEQRQTGEDDRPITCTSCGYDPTLRPGAHNHGTPSLVQASCVWPDEEEQL